MIILDEILEETPRVGILLLEILCIEIPLIEIFQIEALHILLIKNLGEENPVQEIQ